MTEESTQQSCDASSVITDESGCISSRLRKGLSQRIMRKLEFRQVLILIVVGWMVLSVITLGPPMTVEGSVLSDEEMKQFKEFLSEAYPEVQNYSLEPVDLMWLHRQTTGHRKLTVNPRLYPFYFTADQIKDDLRARDTLRMKQLLQMLGKIEKLKGFFHNFHYNNARKQSNVDENNRTEMEPLLTNATYSTYPGPTTVLEDVMLNFERYEKYWRECYCGSPPKPISKADEVQPGDKPVQNPETEATNISISRIDQKIEDIISAKYHGLEAMLAFLVLLPLANFTARFYKEVCGQCKFESGIWIYIHIGMNVLIVLFMWRGIARIVPNITHSIQYARECMELHRNDYDKYKTCIQETKLNTPHLVIGTVTFIMYLLLFVMGFLRPIINSKKIRKIVTAIHNHFGYTCWLVAVLATIVAGYKNLRGGCSTVLIFGVILAITPMLFSVMGVAVDSMEKRTGLVPPRRQWPILEPIKLQERSRWYFWCKWMVFVVFAVVMGVYYTLALKSTMAIINIADFIDEINNETNAIYERVSKEEIAVQEH